MIRNIAGIMADEEPKTPVSPSGLYNSSDISTLGSDAFFNTPSLGNLSEFTITMWLYIDPINPNLYLYDTYREAGSGVNILSIRLTNDGLVSSFGNSNGGVTIVQQNQINKTGEWVNYSVTGSVSNGRIRIYENGVLLNSASMTYSNAPTTLAWIENDDFDLSQLNIYNRELTEAEVAEHYVYDDDTMTSGVLGFDAMTPAQKSGLIYSASFIEDVSIAGGEFNDKSGNGITLSPQPSLTGEQIYVYTNASDLPTYPSNALPSNLPTIL